MIALPTRLVQLEVIDVVYINERGQQNTSSPETRDLDQFKARCERRGMKIVSISDPRKTEAFV